MESSKNSTKIGFPAKWKAETAKPARFVFSASLIIIRDCWNLNEIYIHKVNFQPKCQCDTTFSKFWWFTLFLGEFCQRDCKFLRMKSCFIFFGDFLAWLKCIWCMIHLYLMIPLNFEPLNLTNFQKHQIKKFWIFKSISRKTFEFSDKKLWIFKSAR